MTEQKPEYVVGFLFDPAIYRVVLIKKERPENQKGLYNGVGGKVENFESPFDAMRREFNEEAGIIHDDWKLFCEIFYPDCHVYFFFGVSSLLSLQVELTCEKVSIIKISDLIELECLFDIRWLIPMAIECMYNNASYSYSIATLIKTV